VDTVRTEVPTPGERVMLVWLSPAVGLLVPPGETPRDRVTVPVKPPRLETVRVEVLADPLTIVRKEGLGIRE